MVLTPYTGAPISFNGTWCFVTFFAPWCETLSGVAGLLFQKCNLVGTIRLLETLSNLHVPLSRSSTVGPQNAEKPAHQLQNRTENRKENK